MGIIGIFFFFVDTVLNLYLLILFFRALLSWFPIDPYHPVVRFFHQITEPVLAPIRRILPQTGAIDFSILVAMLIVLALQRLLRILSTGLL